jgi:hypothetical protein
VRITLAEAEKYLTDGTVPDVSACNSGLGQVAQSFDQTTAADCATVTIARDVLAVATVVFSVGCLAGIIDRIRR